MDYRSKKKKKFNFIEKKNCALNSIYDVNCFLSKISKVCTIKKIIKK